jgi:hypothetical protein
MILPPAIVIHGLAHARAALAPGLPVLLLSARGAAGYAGAGWWRALIAAAASPAQPDARVCGQQPDALDCGDQPGRALEALAAGCRVIILDRCPALPAIRARAAGALVLEDRPPALDLAETGSSRRIGAWLQGDNGSTIG